MLKEFFYARSNDGNDLRAGKLLMSRRHNWVDVIDPISLAANPGSLDAIVTETTHYEGPAGLPSSRQTRFSFDGTTFSFVISQEHNELGSVSSLTYPQCEHGQGGCTTSSPARTVSYDYTKGFATSVPGDAIGRVDTERIDHAIAVG